MLLSQEVCIKWNNRNKTYYINKGYKYTNDHDIFNVKVQDLAKGSHAKVKVKCDGEFCDNYPKLLMWKDFIRDVKPDGKYYCRLCAIKLFSGNNSRKTKLNKTISFAQWGINNLGEDFLEKYWDWERNNKIGINPWNISYGFTISKVWIKCQEKDYHESYQIDCSHFKAGKRCSYCVGKKVHILDSLGSIYPQSLLIWSDKNNKSPYEYSYGSGKIVYWKCLNGEHEDYKRPINGASRLNFRCPECQYSVGEKKIEDYLKTYSITYIPQKEFKGLVGIKNGSLSYDFYLPDYNTLIEYQGEFHDCDGGKGTKYMKSKFPIQQEHDRRKKEYAKNNNINLLEIWYWDFNNIEEILNKKLKNKKEAS